MSPTAAAVAIVLVLLCPLPLQAEDSAVFDAPRGACEVAAAARATHAEGGLESEPPPGGEDDGLYSALHEAVFTITAFSVVAGAHLVYRHWTAAPPPKGNAAAQKRAGVHPRPQQKRPSPIGTCASSIATPPPTPPPSRAARCTPVGAGLRSRRASQGAGGASASGDSHLSRPMTPADAASEVAASGTDALVAAVRSGRAAELPQLLDAAYARAKENGQTAQAVAARHLLSALRACATWHKFREALDAYDHCAAWLGPGCPGAVWSLLLYCATEAGDFMRCEEFFDSLCQATVPSGHDFLNMVRFHVQRRDLPGLEVTMAALNGLACQIDALSRNRALAACTSAGALELAEAVAKTVACSEGFDAVAYNTLIKGYAHAGRSARCFDLYEEMKTRGVQPSEMTFGILLDVCNSSRELERAQTLFNDLRRSGLRLNAVHYTTFMKGLVAAGHLDDASELLKVMCQTGETEPDLVTYSMLVKAHADRGEVAAAIEVLQQMLRQGIRPDAVILNIVLGGCAASQMQPCEVFRVLRWLQRHGLQPSTVTLSILIKALVRTVAWEEALELLEAAPERMGLWPEARLHAQLAQACVRAGRVDVALKVYASMAKVACRHGSPVNRASSARVLQIITAAGSESEASEVVLQAVAAAHRLHNALTQADRPLTLSVVDGLVAS